MRVVFIGTGEIGVPVLRWLIASTEHELIGVVTQPDRPVGRDQRIQAPPIKSALEGSAIPILQPERIKRDEAIAEIRALQPEVIVVMAYGQLLPHAVLEIPPIACLNLHASLLPRHRGAAPIQAAIATGDQETGITVMYMDEGLDTGDMLLQSKLMITPTETGGSLHDRLGELAPVALAKALSRLHSGNAPRIPQPEEGVTYAPKLERENGQIDWSESCTVIERKIRAYNPWPGAYVLVRDAAADKRKLKIFSAARVDTTLLPGQMFVSPVEGIVIGASGGSLRLQEVQLEGKRRVAASELIRGHPGLASASA